MSNESIQTFEDREHGSRHLHGALGLVTTLIAFAWSAFQLYIANFGHLNITVVRIAHLAFALSLVFLCFPALRNKHLIKYLGTRLPSLHAPGRMAWWDAILAVAAPASALYFAVNMGAIAERTGIPLLLDLVMGTVLLVLLFDAARRALGPVLPTVACLFVLYCLGSESPWLPDVLQTGSRGYADVIDTLSLGTQGIFGVPLHVSANVVFLFVLFGTLLEKAGGGKYFIDLAFSLVGGFRGGPAKASVLASGLTGMINGSSIANTVTTGTFTIPLMKRSGYPAVKAGAIEVAASTNGQLMPPIMGAAAFIIAEYCQLDYIEVVRAAFLPAFISYITLIYITHIEACKLGLTPIPKKDLPKFWPTLWSGLHFLIPLVTLIYMLIIKRRSPQLSAFIAIVILMIVIVIHDGLSDHRNGWKTAVSKIGKGMVDGARNMMGIGVAVAAAGVIVGTLTMGLSSQVETIISVLSGGSLMGMLVVTAIVSLILGMGLPTTANYIVMANLTAAAIISLSGQFGFTFPLIAVHLFVFYFGILSDDTPPVGLSAYAAAAISRADPIKTGIQGFMYDIRTAILPFMFLFNHELLLIGVHSFWQGVWVFSTALMAMFAFASATQGYLGRKNRWWDTLLLLGFAFVIFRPDVMSGWVSLPKAVWQGGGAAAFLLLAALHGRSRTASSSIHG